MAFLSYKPTCKSCGQDISSERMDDPGWDGDTCCTLCEEDLAVLSADLPWTVSDELDYGSDLPWAPLLPSSLESPDDA